MQHIAHCVLFETNYSMSFLSGCPRYLQFQFEQVPRFVCLSKQFCYRSTTYGTCSRAHFLIFTLLVILRLFSLTIGTRYIRFHMYLYYFWDFHYSDALKSHDSDRIRYLHRVVYPYSRIGPTTTVTLNSK